MKLSTLFSDHLVLQRNVPVAVWGWAEAGDTITISFAGQKQAAQAGSDGYWRVMLQPMPASAEPRQLRAESKHTKQTVTLSDVLVGEVWLASGQSNMWWRVIDSNNADAEIAAADHPLIRLFTVPERALLNPAKDVDAAWKVCSSASVQQFSAAAYFFGRELQKDLGVPIGLINSSWGGTRIEAWTSRPALLTDPAGKRVVDDFEQPIADPKLRQSKESFERDPVAWEREQVMADPGNTGFAQGWAGLDYADAGWGEMRVPCQWQNHGHNFSGVFWFRLQVDVPAAWAGKDLVLHLGACDKQDTTYFNGVHVGAIGWEVVNAWCTPRVYRIPGKLVRAGRNVIATRVYSYMYGGGLIGPADNMYLANEADAPQPSLSLAGNWRFNIEHNFGLRPGLVAPLGQNNPNTPHILYDNMIQPVAPYGLAGAIWYQGESNAGAPRDYRTLFPLMIQDWRKTFAQPNLHFLFVQLANHMAAQQQPVESGWAELREAQTLTLREAHTGMAVAIDNAEVNHLGEAADIHPRNKQEIGRRLALVALAQVYGRKIVPCGPVYRAHQVEGEAIRVHFDHTAGALKTTDNGPVKCFAIADGDGTFHWAKAQIDGETVVLRADGVRRPSAVRYAWANNPTVNLVNALGLPAAPFRTDMGDNPGSTLDS